MNRSTHSAVIGLSLMGCLAFSVPDTARADSELQISEVDYAQPGVDSAEWVEVFNPQDAEYFMDGVELVLYTREGGTCVEYRRIDLSSLVLLDAGEVVVIGVHACAVLSLGASIDAIHDEAGSVIAIERGGVVLYSLEYGADLNTGTCAANRTSEVDLGDGTLQQCWDAWSFTIQGTACIRNSCD